MHFDNLYKILLPIAAAIIAITISFSLGRTSAGWTSSIRGTLIEGIDSDSNGQDYKRITGSELVREMDLDTRQYTIKTAQSGDAAIDLATLTLADKTSSSYVNPNAMFNVVESDEEVIAIQESETPGSLAAMAVEDIEVAFEDLKELQLKYAETEAKYQALVSKADSNETSLRTQLDKLDADIAALQSSLEELALYNSNIAQLEAKEAERDLLRAQLMELNSKIGATVQQKNTLVNQNAALTSQISSLQSQVSYMNSNISMMQMQITNLSIRLNSLLAQLEELNAKIDALTDEINNMQVGVYRTSIGETIVANGGGNVFSNPSVWYTKQNGAQYGRFVTTDGVKKFVAVNPSYITAVTDASGNTFWKCYNVPYIEDLSSVSVKINNYDYSYNYFMQQYPIYYLGPSPTVQLINTEGNTSNTQMWVKWNVDNTYTVPYSYTGYVKITQCDITLIYRK